MPTVSEPPFRGTGAPTPVAATMRRHRSASARPATAPDVRQVAQRGQRAAAEIQAVELHRPGTWVAASAVIRVRSAVDLPDWGAPTTATLPAAPDRSTISGSRRCSNGRSTTPIGTRSGPAPASGSTVQRGAASSGGSQTWCAGGP